MLHRNSAEMYKLWLVLCCFCCLWRTNWYTKPWMTPERYRRLAEHTQSRLFKLIPDFYRHWGRNKPRKVRKRQMKQVTSLDRTVSHVSWRKASPRIFERGARISHRNLYPSVPLFRWLDGEVQHFWRIKYQWSLTEVSKWSSSVWKFGYFQRYSRWVGEGGTPNFREWRGTYTQAPGGGAPDPDLITLQATNASLKKYTSHVSHSPGQKYRYEPGVQWRI